MNIFSIWIEIGLVLYYASYLALLVLALMPLIAVATAKFMIHIEPRYKRIRELVAQLNMRFLNNIGEISVIKAFDRYATECQRVDVQSDAYRDEKDEGSDERILDRGSLDIPAGTTVGFAGPSGSGKSTLLKLLPRFYDVTAGSVRIDGQDMRDYDVQTLRDEIGIVEQDPDMFSGTVRENIAYGDRGIFAAVTGHSTGREHRDRRGTDR